MDDLTRKYVGKINQDLAPHRERPELSSRQYKEFKEEYLPKHLGLYERLCQWSGRALTVKPDKKKRPLLEQAIESCHLEITPEGVYAFSLLGPIVFIVAVSVLTLIAPVTLGVLLGKEWAGSLFLLVFGVIIGLGSIIPLQRLPFYLANSWRMQASNQMVLCIFYVVTFMRHTSNLELAIDFAAEHLAPPLSLDMKKIIWDIETERYESIKESLDRYLESWQDWNPEFVESMHLIEGSLVEGSETRRLELLDKALSVMLQETYEKMLHYAHNLKSPLTTLHMLGVILPILGLVILPLMVNFIPEVKWYMMAVVYNVVLPLLVYVLAKAILSTRPTGYGNADITDLNPELRRLKRFAIRLGGKDLFSISPAGIGLAIMILLVFVGFFPLLYHATSPSFDWIVTDRGIVPTTIGSDAYKEATVFFLDYRPGDPRNPSSPRTNGPNGMGAVLLSLLIPLGLGLGTGAFYSIKSGNVMKIREKTRKLEQEFASSLFQLGNRLGDGIPAEIAFAKVGAVLRGTNTGRFFDIVTDNITRLGMNIERAIFDPARGALLAYPSNIIESSMKVLVESSKKGPLVASQALISVSEYIKQMHRVDERLKDLMADVISSMKSQVQFLTPVIAGIVVGITSMISSILGIIATKLQDLTATTGNLGQAGNAGAIFDAFGSGSIPTYHFQAIVGLYVVQITIILTIMVNGIENGTDELAKEYLLGRNLIRSLLLYSMVSGITIVLFGFIAKGIANI